MIRLHQYPPMFGIPNPSPFYLKLETWLRMAGLPALARPLVGHVVRKTIQKALHVQGLGRHSQDEIYRLGCDDLDALSAFLGEKQYFFGERPTEIDATAYGFLAQILWAAGSRQLREHMQQSGNLSALCERMKQTYYAGGAS